MTYVDFTKKTARFLYHNTTNLSTFGTARENAELQDVAFQCVMEKSILSILGVSGVPHDHFMPLKRGSKRKIFTKQNRLKSQIVTPSRKFKIN